MLNSEEKNAKIARWKFWILVNKKKVKIARCKNRILKEKSEVEM